MRGLSIGAQNKVLFSYITVHITIRMNYMQFRNYSHNLLNALRFM